MLCVRTCRDPRRKWSRRNGTLKFLRSAGRESPMRLSDSKTGKPRRPGSARSLDEAWATSMLPRRRVIVKDMKSRNGSSALLERLLEPLSQSLNVEAARKLIKLKADPATQARIDELARKCNEGDLTPS